MFQGTLIVSEFAYIPDVDAETLEETNAAMFCTDLDKAHCYPVSIFIVPNC